MLVRRKDLCFAFCARRGLRYWVNGLTVLAPEAEAPRVLRLEALCSYSRFKQKSLSDPPPAGFSSFSKRSGSESHGGRPRNATFFAPVGYKGLIRAGIYETFLPSLSAIFRMVDK